MAFMDELRDYVIGQQSATGPGAATQASAGMRTPQPRPFVAPPGALPSSPVGRPRTAQRNPVTLPNGASSAGAANVSAGGAGAGSNAGGASQGVAMPTMQQQLQPQPLASPLGTRVVGTNGQPEVLLSPEGQQAYRERVQRGIAAFGPYPFASDPSAPPPPITPGKPFINPFTGRWGRA